MTLFDLLMAIGLMMAAGAAMSRIDKGMSERELRAYHIKQNRKRRALSLKAAK